ncbi:MAG: low molecular weight phosphotyrosine protein phosphatase [archaeon]|nr:low molecular weight phosphotyrosine protein phosphatase [archaeon]
MHSILFVCYANVCRSPIAEFVMKQLVKDARLSGSFRIESAGTDPDTDADIWFRSKETMDAHKTPWEHRCARQLLKEEYGEWDLFIAMDYQNMDDIMDIFGDDPDGKVRLLRGTEIVEDPYYHGDFDRAYKEIREGCERLLGELTVNSPRTF